MSSHSKSSREKKSKKEARRAIPESLTGREVYWSLSYLEKTDEISFREDLGNVAKASHRLRRRRKSRVGEAQSPDAEKQLREPRIILDPDGFPIKIPMDSQ